MVTSIQFFWDMRYVLSRSILKPDSSMNEIFLSKQNDRNICFYLTNVRSYNKHENDGWIEIIQYL